MGKDRLLPVSWSLPLLVACVTPQGDSATTSPPVDTPSPTDSHTHAEPAVTRHVRVTLDDEPTAGITVFQGGLPDRYETDGAGEATVPIDPELDGELWVLAAHPDARTDGAQVWDLESTETLEIALTRFSTADNAVYVFEHAGTPEDRSDTGRCAHCHITINAAWHASPHATAASNPWVQDLYAGAAAAYEDEAACLAAGGRWWTGLAPGTAEAAQRCYLGAGALPDLNGDCGDTAPCDGVATETGACADCHAPAIDGELGGRDLLEAVGEPFESGVSCDLCHKVAQVDLDAPAGVAGRLGVVRPSEEPTSMLLGDWQPLTFGPFDDVASIRMGGVQRDHFADGTLCAGCHQLDQPVLVPGASADPERWPDGTLPIHSTWEEHQAGPLADAPCQSCHMPPDPTVGNAADLGNEIEDVDPGVVGGWYRPPGEVRLHAWYGPRQPESGMLELAATVDVTHARDGDTLTLSATVTNVGPGHALPTGEPLRHLLLRVDARCDGASLTPTGGDALPAWAGALASQGTDGDWLSWPGASPGEQLLVVARTGSWHAYTGTGPFGDGTFDTEAKGLPVEHLLGTATITAVDGDVVTLATPLPEGGTAVYRLPAHAWPTDDQPGAPLAGRPGFAFARVLADADGELMVPHHRAIDVVSDNRLMPGGGAWTSTHSFSATCDTPTLHAALLYRAAPYDLVQQRGWDRGDRILAEVSR